MVYESRSITWAIERMRSGLIVEDFQGRMYKTAGHKILASDDGGVNWEPLAFITVRVVLSDYWLIVPDPANPDA